MEFSYCCCPFSFPMKGICEKEYRPEKEDDILIIQNSSVGTSAGRRYQSTNSSYTEYTEWDNSNGDFFQKKCSSAIQEKEVSASQNGKACLPEEKSTQLSENIFLTPDETASENSSAKSVLENEMDALMQRFHPFQLNGIPTVNDRLEMVRDIKSKSLDYLLYILFGESDKAVHNTGNSQTHPNQTTPDLSYFLSSESSDLTQISHKGGSYRSFYYCSETETTCFDTLGTAVTADGRKLSFHISLEMSRSFTQMAKEQIDFGEPRLCDPLVINLNSNAASISDQKFFFDIDADGTEDEISMLDASSGYLALDKNNDGQINDGSELFGTQSGNGFSDLLAYDEDGNGWIDEADSIFRKLKIWTMDENGTSTLLDLKEAGVGAIYLGYEDTKFSLKNDTNHTDAVIQNTGMFLYEDGSAGTIQQMDLAV